MTLCVRFTVACLAIMLIAPLAGQTLAPGRSAAGFVAIDYPGAKNTQAYDINAAGDIVGGYDSADNIGHGFLLRKGNYTSIDYPGAKWTQARAISPQGWIVGVYTLPNENAVHSFLLLRGEFYPIDVTGQPHPSPSTYVLRISSNGTIVGCYHVNNAAGGSDPSTMYGFTLTKDGYSSFEVGRSMHAGVNSAGDISGTYVPPTGPLQSYLIRDGVMSWFSLPGAFATVSQNISDTGAIVGWYRDQARVLHGFLAHNGEVTTIDVDLPGASMTQPYGINAAGDIVGVFSDAKGTHGFLRTAAR